MSWLHCLIETYDVCFGQPQFASDPLIPIDHVEQQAHLEIVLNAKGEFDRASIVQKENTLIPATEKSAGRGGNSVTHPLCDKLRYIAADYGSADHQLYLNQLRSWNAATAHPKLRAILTYVEHGTVVKDLVAAGLLTVNGDGLLEKEWVDGLSTLARVLTADPKTKQRDQGNALIRWRVDIPGDLEAAVWKDVSLQHEWRTFNSGLPAISGLCMASGMEEPLAFCHPRRLRHGADPAKLISKSDISGYTFRGRFVTAAEAYGLGSSATQKAHHALRWLIRRHGTKHGDQVVVSWATHGERTPPLAASTWELFVDKSDKIDSNFTQGHSYLGDDRQAFASRLGDSLSGYRTQLGQRSNIIVMALKSATAGRMAILYYRELRSSEFFERIVQWHSALAWPQDFGQEIRFVGAPAPSDIAEAAYGRRVNDELRNATLERLLPCIVDGRPLPRDLMLSAVARASNRAILERWEFERVLGVACSLVRGSRSGEDYHMSLEEYRSSRSYLFGRLLAVAERMERNALDVAGESRDTAAERLMQRFAARPAATWCIIQLAMRPYIQQLQSLRPAALFALKQLLDEILELFEGDDFTRSGRLDPEFLLGYHCQRAALRVTKPTPSSVHEGRVNAL